MSDANSEDYSDENDPSSESSDDESEDSTYDGKTFDVKKSKKRNSSRSKNKKKSKLKTSHLKSKTAKRRGRPKLKRAKMKDSLKEEFISDDSLSQMSDINPPSIATRSRKKRSASSTSSTLDSGVRETKSEPILIIIDSDSENVLSSSMRNRPNRSARVQGEMIRKLNLMSHHEPKSGYSSSSSTSNVKRRRKQNSSVGMTSKENVYLSSRLKTRSRHLKIKCAKVYVSPLKETRRLKIKSIHKRFQRINKDFLPKRSSRQASLKSVKLSGDKKSTKRLSALHEQVENNIQEQPESSAQVRPKKLGRPRKIKTSPPEAASDIGDIEDDIRKINDASNASEKSNGEMRLSDSKVSSNGGNDQHVKEELDDDSCEKVSSIDDKSVKNDSSNENNSRSIEIDITLNDIKSDLEKINNSTPDAAQAELSNHSEGETKRKIRLFPRSKMARKALLKKIKVKQPNDVIRRRGRPRLSEAKPVVTNTEPVETTSILNIKAQVPFLQNSFCFDVAQKIPKCRECRLAVYRNSKKMYNSYCRFMEYRKLCYTKQGLIITAGFSNPSDATPEHLSQWLPHPQDPPNDLNFATARSLLAHVGDQFCDLVLQEEEALELHVGLRQPMTWKRIVQGVREMCDVCSTTIFNIHWVCPTCGFAVCIDCYKVRKLGIVVEDDEDQPRDRDNFKWLLCTQRSAHTQDSLVMAQMIPGQALWIMKDLMHKARKKWQIVSHCKCNEEQNDATALGPGTTHLCKQLMSAVTKSFLPLIKHVKEELDNSLLQQKNPSENNIIYDDFNYEVSAPGSRWLEGSCMSTDIYNNNFQATDDGVSSYEDFSALKRDLLGSDKKTNDESNVINFNDESNVIRFNDGNSFTLGEITDSVVNHVDKNTVTYDKFCRYPSDSLFQSSLCSFPVRLYTKLESNSFFPEVPHSWFCGGKLLFLHKANHKNNLPLFQDQWKRGQPIVVQGVDEGLDMDLWRPEGFCRDFGEVKNDLVDCKTGAILKNMPMKKFWEGFENFNKRLTDENGEYMLLKLKDWPPGEDFSEKLPTRFEDLMKGLPLPEYTHRDGILNLAGRLPPSFVRPDLGPKMYNAYGSALFPQKGTTNLHLDISDAVNVMVYVGIPSDGKCETHIHEAMRAIDEGGCDTLMRARVRDQLAKPGALWHIYNAKDADKIREMLTKVAIERGEKLEAHHDPIHDQSWYIDSELRHRLYSEYGVEGYAIAQCLGDAVFIPAGAPHQVRNLHSCVKVAEDFVSPENIAHCFKLTQEFRNLSETHTNHEDKLQIKNIIYHVVRDSLSFLVSPDEPMS